MALPPWSLALSISSVASSPPRIRSARAGLDVVLGVVAPVLRHGRLDGMLDTSQPLVTAPCALPLLEWPSQQAGTPGVRRLVLHDFPSIASCLVKRFYPVHLQDFRSIRPAPVSALRSTKQRVPGYFRVFPCRHDADLRSASASRAMLLHSFRVLGRCASCEPVLLATGLP